MDPPPSTSPRGDKLSPTHLSVDAAKSSPSLSAEQQLALNSAAFEALERDFRSVLNELVGDKSLERFRQEYEKLHFTLKKSHENEKRLIKKCRELNTEIVSNASKIQTALRLSLQDQNSIALLKKEIDKAWRMVDGAQEKERSARETISRLKAEITNLSRLVDQGAGLSIGQENAVNDLLARKEEMSAELARQSVEIARHLEKIDSLHQTIDTLQTQQAAAHSEINSLKEQLNAQKAEVARQTRRAERLQNEMLLIKQVNDKRKAELALVQARWEQLNERYQSSDDKLRGMTLHLDKYQSVADELKGQADEREKEVGKLASRLAAAQAERSTMVQTVSELGQANHRLEAELQTALKRMAKLEREKNEVVSLSSESARYREWMRGELKQLAKGMEAQSSNAAQDERLIKELQLQIKRLTQSLLGSSEKNQQAFAMLQEGEAVRHVLSDDLTGLKHENQQLRSKIYQLEKSRETESLKANQWFQRHAEAAQQMQALALEKADLLKAIEEERQKSKVQQNLYEQVRSDRNLFSKQQQAAQDEMGEMLRSQKILMHQIQQLKEEINQKDSALINQHFAYKKLSDEMRLAKRKLVKRKEVLSKADQVLTAQDNELHSLRRVLAEAEQVQSQQKRQFDAVVGERDLLGAQLIRRNDELSLLYEKIRIQQVTLQKGEGQYRQRLLDIRNLKLEMNNIKRQMQMQAFDERNVEQLKGEVYHLQRELLVERTKVKALSEELENPLNVHRWRKLEGTDPAKLDLIQKISLLQKRLILKTEECVAAQQEVEEKTRLYQQMKTLLSKQPGPEMTEQLNKYSVALKAKSNQIKAMTGEINMLNAQVSEYRFEAERLNRELIELKKKYYEQRKTTGYFQQQIDKTQAMSPEQQLAQQQLQQFTLIQPKIVGGGFNLSALSSGSSHSKSASQLGNTIQSSQT